MKAARVDPEELGRPRNRYFDNMQNQLHDQWSMLLADDGIRLKCAIRDGMQYKIANIGRYVGTGDEHFFATLVDEPPNYTYKFYVSETWEHLSAAHKRAMCLMRVAWGKAHLVQTNLDNKFPQHAARAEELKAPATVHDELKAPATVRLDTLLLHLGTLRLTLTSNQVQTNLDNTFPQHAARAEELKAPATVHKAAATVHKAAATVHDELKAPATVRLATLLLHLGTLRLTLTSVCMRSRSTLRALRS